MINRTFFLSIGFLLASLFLGAQPAKAGDYNFCNNTNSVRHIILKNSEKTTGYYKITVGACRDVNFAAGYLYVKGYTPSDSHWGCIRRKYAFDIYTDSNGNLYDKKNYRGTFSDCYDMGDNYEYVNFLRLPSVVNFNRKSTRRSIFSIAPPSKPY